MDLVCILLQLYLFALVGRALLSWFPVTPGTFLASLNTALYRITEPVLGPLRRAIPPARIGRGALDLSPMIVLIGLYIVMGYLC